MGDDTKLIGCFANVLWKLAVRLNGSFPVLFPCSDTNPNSSHAGRYLSVPFSLTRCDVAAVSLCLVSREEMENKAMYLSTYEERANGSVYEEAYEGHNLSKLNLCDEGEQTAHVPTETELHLVTCRFKSCAASWAFFKNVFSLVL